MLDSIYALSPEALTARGIKLLLMDLDNTLVPYGIDKASPALLNWTDSMKKAGIELFVLSNNSGPRPAKLANQLSVGFIGRARKPFTKKLLSVLVDKNTAPESTAIIGDQIYTDILCGRRCGVFSIAVRPISLRNPLLLLRYGLEYPFRRLGRKI